LPPLHSFSCVSVSTREAFFSTHPFRCQEEGSSLSSTFALIHLQRTSATERVYPLHRVSRALYDEAQHHRSVASSRFRGMPHTHPFSNLELSPPPTTLGDEHICLFSRHTRSLSRQTRPLSRHVHFRGWQPATLTTSHYPWKRTHMFVFEAYAFAKSLSRHMHPLSRHTHSFLRLASTLTQLSPPRITLEN